MKETVTGLRRLWTIVLSLDGKKRTRKEIVDYNNKLNKKLISFDKSIKIKSLDTNEDIQASVLKYLSKNNIMKREPIPIEGSNLTRYKYYIDQNLDSFENIVLEISKNDIEPVREKFFLRTLINSIYGKMFINENLIPSLLKKHKLPYIEFKDHEKYHLKSILRASPSALKYSVISIKNKEDEWKYPKIKESLFFRLISFLLEEIYDPKNSIEYTSYNHYYTFNLTTFFNLPTELNKTPHIEMNSHLDKLDLQLERVINRKNIDLDDVIKEYLKTYNFNIKIDKKASHFDLDSSSARRP